MNNKLTWANVNSYDSDSFEEEFEELCQNSKAKDFYFDVRIGSDDFVANNAVIVSITPKDQFDLEGFMYDQQLDLEHILPDYVFDIMECTWESEKSLEETKKDLLERGFLESKTFSDLITKAFA